MALTNFGINFNSTIETVSFGTFTKMFELGEISFLIDFFKESEIQLLLIHFRNQKNLLKDFSDKEMSKVDVSKRFQVSTTFRIVNSFISDLDCKYKHYNDSRVGDLLFLFPLAELLMKYRNHYGYKSSIERYSEYHMNYTLKLCDRIKASLSEYIDSIKKNPKRLIKDMFITTSDGPITYDEKVYRALDHIGWHFYSGEQFLMISQDSTVAYCQAVIDYCDSIINNLEGIRCKKPLLNDFLKDRAKSESLNNDLPPWISDELKRTLKPEWVLSLISAIAQEQEYLYKRKFYTRVCPVCNSSFIAKKNSAECCSYLDPKNNGKSCQEIAAERDSFEKNKKLFPLLDKNRKTYRNWLKRQYKQYPNIFASKNGSFIERELEHIYANWYREARSALDSYENGKIELEEAELQINLPEIEYRSPLLYKLTHK